MSSVKEKARLASELYEQKERAFTYYEENGVPKKMEDILNSMFYDRPDDVFGHIANYFESFAKTPTVSKIKSRVVLDSKAQPSAQTDLYCTIKNFEKLIQTSTSTNESYPPETAKPEDLEQSILDRQKFVETAISFINEQFADALLGTDPTKQEEIDAIIFETLEKAKQAEAERLAKEKEENGEDEALSPTGQTPAPGSASPSKARKSASKGKGGKAPAVVIIPDEPREELLCGSSAVTSLSQCVCQAGAQIADIPLYRHIAMQRLGAEGNTCELTMPLPMVAIMTSGKIWPGKLNCVKEFMVVPKPDMPLKESIKHIIEIYNFCAKSISAKTGIIARNANDLGCLCPTFDRPEQGLDLLQEAISHQNLKPGEDFHIALNIAGHEHFDYDKGKYEVTAGAQKLGEDLVDFYGDLLTRYPSIIAIIDPMRKQDKEAWMKLCEKISENTYIIGDVVHHRPGLLKDEEILDEFKTSGVVFKMENVNTITDLIAAAKKMREADNVLVVGCQVAESSDSFLADLAVGLGAKFLKLGAPCRGERVAKLNRLLQIEDKLMEEAKLGQLGEHVFPIVKPPTPPPTPVEGEEEGQGEGEAENKEAEKKE